MTTCDRCDAVSHCRVPRDRLLMAKVLDRLEHQNRNGMLCAHLHRYVDAESCLVHDGHVDL